MSETQSLAMSAVDDPSKDYNQRYGFPMHWNLDYNSHFGIDYRSYMGLALQLLPKEPGVVLDAGCGDGFLARQLVDAGHRVVGVDLSEQAVRFARLYVPEGEFHSGDLRTILDTAPLQHGSADVVMCIETIEHIPEVHHPKVLANLRTALKPGGRLIISVPTTRMPLNRWHYKHYTEDEFQQLVTDAGFRCDAVFGQNRAGLWTSVAFWRLLTNRVYDLVMLRRLLQPWLAQAFSRVEDPRAARRLILVATATRE